jgi:hypothetical protein
MSPSDHKSACEEETGELKQTECDFKNKKIKNR